MADLKGSVVVVYFYPRDDTPACTQEAQDFSCLAEEFAAAGAKVFGISTDTMAKHAKFRKKYDLAIPLLSDTDKVAAQSFGVWVEKSMFGRPYMGVERSTFLFDRAGKLVTSWRKVRVAGHAEEVLAAVRQLGP